MRGVVVGGGGVGKSFSQVGDGFTTGCVGLFGRRRQM